MDWVEVGKVEDSVVGTSTEGWVGWVPLLGWQ